MNAVTKSVQLPSRINSALLLKHAREGEPVIVLKIEGLGFTQDYDLQVESRSFLFRYDLKLGGHVLRAPFHIWMQDKAKLAHDLMARKQRHPFVTLIEFTPLAQAAEVPTTQGGETVTHQPHNLETEGSTPSPETIPTEQEPPAVLMYGEMPLHQAIADLVRDGAIRIKAVAHQLEVSEDDIKTALAAPDSSAELASAGWVRLIHGGSPASETPAE